MKKLNAFLLTMALTASTLGGFAGQTALADETEAPAEMHEVYTLTNELTFAGMINPYEENRTDIEKAWPKERASDSTVKIGISTQSLVSDFFIDLNGELDAACEEYGYEVTHLNADGDTQAQSGHIDTFISMGVDIIILDPIDSTTPVADGRRAVEAGIPVLCIGTVPQEFGYLTTICSDCFVNGFEAGKYAIECGTFEADEAIKSTVVIGVMGSSTSESRVCGMIAGLMYARMEQLGSPYACEEDAYMAGYDLFQTLKTTGRASSEEANFDIAGMGVGDWTVEGGLAATEDLATAHPDMNFIFAENDFMAAGARRALGAVDMNDQVDIICASDGTSQGLEMVKSGDILCTGLGSPIEEGRFAIDFVKAIFEEGADPTNLSTLSPFNIGIITKENVDEYYEEGNPYYKVSEFTFPKSIEEIKAEYAG